MAYAGQEDKKYLHMKESHSIFHWVACERPRAHADTSEMEEHFRRFTSKSLRFATKFFGHMVCGTLEMAKVADILMVIHGCT